MPNQRSFKRKNKKPLKKRIASVAYQVNHDLPFFNELRNLVLKISPPPFPNIERGLKKIGRVKLAVVTGSLLNIPNTRVDLMVVGDNIEYKHFGNFIKNLENDLGMELRYVVLGLNEFTYRYDMYDRFVHDILEYPHKKLINRIGELK